MYGPRLNLCKKIGPQREEVRKQSNVVSYNLSISRVESRFFIVLFANSESGPSLSNRPTSWTGLCPQIELPNPCVSSRKALWLSKSRFLHRKSVRTVINILGCRATAETSRVRREPAEVALNELSIKEIASSMKSAFLLEMRNHREKRAQGYEYLSATSNVSADFA